MYVIFMVIHRTTSGLIMYRIKEIIVVVEYRIPIHTVNNRVILVQLKLITQISLLNYRLASLERK